MGFLRRFSREREDRPNFGTASGNGDTRPAWMTDGMTVTLIEGDEVLEVSGESYHLDELRKIEREIGREAPALVVPEPENSYDS